MRASTPTPRGAAVDEPVTAERKQFFRSLWPSGAPIEAWAEKCLDPAVKLLSQYVLHLEARISDADRVANDLMAVAYANTISSEEARERFPGWGEDVA